MTEWPKINTEGMFPSNQELSAFYAGVDGPIPPGPRTHNGDLQYIIMVPGKTEQSNRCLGILGEMWSIFVEKNNGYGEPTPDDLGSKGQYADMHRKWKRIRSHLWDGEPWPTGGESFEEVLFDFMGHLMLTIDHRRNGK